MRVVLDSDLVAGSHSAVGIELNSLPIECSWNHTGMGADMPGFPVGWGYFRHAFIEALSTR